jgi:hypothetical protein
VAKTFLSAIIGEEVLEFDFVAQEHTLRHPKKREEKQVEEDEKLLSIFTAKQLRR